VGIGSERNEKQEFNISTKEVNNKIKGERLLQHLPPGGRLGRGSYNKKKRVTVAR
jgi:hypothetical protein